MRTAGSFYVKTHLSALLEEVEHGETVEITRRGKPIARIVPIESHDEARARALEALAYFKSLEPQPLPDGVTYKDLINMGRKY